MNMIERYLQAIGKELPANQREDILKELRSSLYDMLEGEEEASDERVAAILREMGSPREVAARYYPEGQYIVGPAFYPTFLTVLKIALASVIGVQLVAILASITNGRGFSPFDEMGGLFATVPMVLGWVVIVFWLMQRAQTKPDPEAPFDPRKLPALEPAYEPVNRAEQLFSIFVTLVALSLLAQFVEAGGFAWRDAPLFLNPVITRWFPWILLSFLAGIVIDIILLWRGRWEPVTRIAAIVSNLFSLGVLYVLIAGHNAWLDAAGIGGNLDYLRNMGDLLRENPQAMGMASFRIGLGIAALITAWETVVYLYKLPRDGRRTSHAPTTGGAAVAL